MAVNSDAFLNAEEVARYLNLGKNTVYELAKSGKLASYRIGRKLRFTIEDADAYLTSTHGGAFPADNASGSSTSVAFVAGSPDASELAAAAAFDALPEPAFTVAGGDKLADMLAGALCARGVNAARLVRGAYTSLVNLYAGEADAAVVDLFDQSANAWNVPYVRNLAPGASVVVFRLVGRRAGFVVATGNPKKIRTWGTLLHEGVVLANRAKGSGARVLLDEKLRAMDARAENVSGYADKEFAGTEAVARVAKGMADVTVAYEGDVAGVAGVEFVPLVAASVDFVVRKTPETRAVIRKVKALLADGSFAREVSAADICDVSKLGAIVYES